MEIIDNVDRSTMFLYVSIFIIILFIFSKIEIKLNVIFGTFVAIGILTYLYSNSQKSKRVIDELNIKKINSVLPLPQTKEHKEIINFLFSIQDLYVINPQVYENMVEHVDYFFDLYKETLNNDSLAGMNYQLMVDQKRFILNSLMQIDFGMKQNTEYDLKLEKSVKVMENILDNYLSLVHTIYNEHVYKHGLDSKTVIINRNKEIRPYNTYNDKLFSVDMY